MADTQTTVETEHRQNAGVLPQQGVEVFDTNGAAANHDNSAVAAEVASNDVGFGHADLRHAEVHRGNANAANFRSTDLRDSELNTADFQSTNRTALDTGTQSTNWGTILMVIALILLIILIGSWFF